MIPTQNVLKMNLELLVSKLEIYLKKNIFHIGINKFLYFIT